MPPAYCNFIFRVSHSKDKSRESKCSFGFFGPSGETRLHLRRKAQIEVATSVCTGGCNMPPAYCDLIFRVSLNTNKKCYKPQKRFIAFWSEWRDSNSRHPGPKRILNPTSNRLRHSLIISARKWMLSGHLVSAVSVCSDPGCGQNMWSTTWFVR